MSVLSSGNAHLAYYNRVKPNNLDARLVHNKDQDIIMLYIKMIYIYIATLRVHNVDMNVKLLPLSTLEPIMMIIHYNPI